MRQISKIFLFILYTQLCIANNSADFQWPKHQVTPIFQAFLAVYNQHNLEALQHFTKKYYAGENPSEWPIYWMSLYQEYRNLEPYGIAQEWTAENRLAIWCQGKDTKAWVLLFLIIDQESNQVIGKSVLRNSRPSGLLPPYTAIKTKKVKKYLTNYLQTLEKLDYFSGTVLVAKGNRVLFEGAYGMRDHNHLEKNTLTTSFGIGSTSKTFTALAIAQLAEKGKLNYQDPMSKFISEYPKDIADQVTIHHLLTHTSGIELDDYEPFNQDAKAAKNVEDLLNAQLLYIDSMNEGRRQNFKVLAAHDYSNENYTLLGVIIERVSGMSYEKYIEKYILEPLQMESTFVNYHKLAQHQNKAIGYSDKNQEGKFLLGKKEANTDQIWHFAVPYGGIYASTHDLYTFFKAINAHQLISEESKILMQQKHILSLDFLDQKSFYGYGFIINHLGKAHSIGHDGAYHGIGSCFEYYPEQDYYVIVLSNYGAAPARIVANHLKDLIEPND